MLFDVSPPPSIQLWEERLINIQETIDEWLKMQAQWLYLEPIFSSADIMQQMPEEGQLFQTVDRNWKEIMRHCVKDPRVGASKGVVRPKHIFLESSYVDL